MREKIIIGKRLMSMRRAISLLYVHLCVQYICACYLLSVHWNEGEVHLLQEEVQSKHAAANPLRLKL
jgi:hypothetical protein